MTEDTQARLKAIAERAAEGIAFLDQVFLSLPEMEWGAPSPRTDEEHLRDFADTLRLTREHFPEMPEKTSIHGLYLTGTEIVGAHIGNSPTSADRARTLSGLVGSIAALRQLLTDAAAEIARLSALTSREEVLEEAASIAEQNSFMCLHGRNPKSVKSDIAAAIRALKVKP